MDQDALRRTSPERFTDSGVRGVTVEKALTLATPAPGLCEALQEEVYAQPQRSPTGQVSGLS